MSFFRSNMVLYEEHLDLFGEGCYIMPYSLIYPPIIKHGAHGSFKWFHGIILDDLPP